MIKLIHLVLEMKSMGRETLSLLTEIIKTNNNHNIVKRIKPMMKLLETSIEPWIRFTI
jgi:hypothetical protein